MGNEKKEEFEAKGFLVLDTFEDSYGRRYAVYHMNPNNPLTFVTGDRFEWMTGLRYDSEIKQIVLDYSVEEEVKRKIESVLRFAQK